MTIADQGAGVPAEPPTTSAFNRSLRLLDRRPHFRREIELKLARAGFEDSEISAAVERLVALGYLDDVAAARNHAAFLAARKGFGATRIRAELVRRGAPAEAIAAALPAIGQVGEDGELERARETAAKWLRRGAASRAESSALARHLDRKGYERRVIFSVLKELAPGGEGEPFAEE